MNTNRARVALAAVVLVSAFATSGADREIREVRTSDELFVALGEANTERTIRLQRGLYAVDRPLTVPDGVALVGEGVMRFDAAGLPLGFEPGTETNIEVTSGFTGDLLTLRNGASIHNLKLQELADDPGSVTRRLGNVVVVTSRAPGDGVAAAIVECEITSPNPSEGDANGPTGRALAVFTRNDAGSLPPPPHEGATLSVHMERSVIHASAESGTVFAINFAARGNTEVTLSHNRLEGTFIATGGANRPDPVSGARTVINSEHNLFISPSDARGARGWMLFGGSSQTHMASPEVVGLSFNTLRMRSNFDRIEGFTVGVFAAAGRRLLAGSGPVSDNLLELDLTGLQIRSEGAGAADVVLYAALSEQDAVAGREFPSGDRNVLRMKIAGATGSGERANIYAADFGPVLPANLGTGNRIEIVGDPAEFARSNTGLEPLPPPEYFVGKP
jgi:hypothetical protein